MGPLREACRDAYTEMRDGKRPFNPTSKEDEEAIARAARWFVYRINWTEYLEKTDGSSVR